MVKSIFAGANRVNSIPRDQMQRSRAVQPMQQDIQVDIKRSDALVIGNGRSRLQFDLHELHKIFTTYGCNALYRDFMPDYLVALDRYMAYEILDNKIDQMTEFYSQNDSTFNRYKDSKINYVICDRRLGDSGTSAMRLAAKNKHKKVYMIGFDYTDNNRYTDNVYSGTKHYGVGPITNGGLYMLQQWETRVRGNCKEYKDTMFYRVDGIGYKPTVPYDNFTNITVERFKEITNELQDG